MSDSQPQSPESRARSFSSLYAEAAPALFTWANVRLPPSLRGRLDPEDVVQEVACRAYDQFDAYDRGRPFRAWLFGFAQNVIRESLRNLRGASASPPVRISTALLASLPADASSVSRRVARDESLKLLIRRLDRLEGFDRKILLYRGLEGLTHAEVAQTLGITVAAAEKHWARLLERLDDGRFSLDLFVR